MDGSWPGRRRLPTLLPWSEVDSVSGGGQRRWEEGGKEADRVEKRGEPPGERNGRMVEVGGKELGVDRVRFPGNTNEAEGQSGPHAKMKSSVPRGGHRQCPRRQEQPQSLTSWEGDPPIQLSAGTWAGGGAKEIRLWRDTRHWDGRGRVTGGRWHERPRELGHCTTIIQWFKEVT